MTSLYHRLPVGDNIPEEVNVVIEISEGSHMKYEYDHDLGIFVLDRVNYAPMPFPCNYGFIPQCWNSDDNDPADAVVVASHPIDQGVMVPCQVIGMIEMIDGGEKDDKIVCVPVDDERLYEVNSYEDFPAHFLKQLEYYFAYYKKIKNKDVEVRGFLPKEEAFKKITKGIEDHKEKYGA